MDDERVEPRGTGRTAPARAPRLVARGVEGSGRRRRARRWAGATAATTWRARADGSRRPPPDRRRARRRPRSGPSRGSTAHPTFPFLERLHDAPRITTLHRARARWPRAARRCVAYPAAHGIPAVAWPRGQVTRRHLPPWPWQPSREGPSRQRRSARRMNRLSRTMTPLPGGLAPLLGERGGQPLPTPRCPGGGPGSVARPSSVGIIRGERGVRERPSSARPETRGCSPSSPSG